MSEAKYTMITVAACDPGFIAEAVPLTVKLAGELIEKAGSIGARAGTVITGHHVGSLFLAQTYTEIAGIERAIDLYAGSATYGALINSGKVNVSLRSILKLENASIEPMSTEAPGYLVLTRWKSADPMTDRLRALLPVFKENGAMLARYGTSIAGPMAGVRVLGVAYPSMDAIEKTYADLTSNTEYQSYVADVEIVSRNMVRIAG
ncbi:DUF6854 domain-containing protein [Ruegeria hyattellae]|uniref:DUF6854 domain-containing protein n=1 Tax=Ruegeria hyattellae TaxID=3233337 RepID=UPI00355B71AD